MMYTKASNKNKTTHESATNTHAGLTVQGRVSSMSAATDSTPDLPTKQCSKCKEFKPLTPEFFQPRISSKDGYRNDCKMCRGAYNREYRLLHHDELAEKDRQEYQENRERILAERRVYYAANREKIDATHRRWRLANPDKKRQHTKNWCANNPEKVKARAARWRKNNPEKLKILRWRRRARAHSAEGANLPFDEKAQLKRQKGKCYYCQCKLGKYHIDHVIPLSRGGSDHPDNKVLACPHCNHTKSAKLPHEFVKGGRLL